MRIYLIKGGALNLPPRENWLSAAGDPTADRVKQAALGETGRWGGGGLLTTNKNANMLMLVC